jgi:putative endonuclease
MMLSLSKHPRIKMEEWYVYIAKSRTNRYYVGMTMNVDKRIVRHNSSRGSRFAINQGPFEVVYISDSYSSKSEARKREIQLKGWKRVKKEKLINGDWS